MAPRCIMDEALWRKAVFTSRRCRLRMSDELRESVVFSASMLCRVVIQACYCCCCCCCVHSFLHARLRHVDLMFPTCLDEQPSCLRSTWTAALSLVHVPLNCPLMCHLWSAVSAAVGVLALTAILYSLSVFGIVSSPVLYYLKGTYYATRCECD